MASTYDFKKVTLTINGAIISGFADGDAIVKEASEETVTAEQGADGTVEFINTNKTMETLTLQLQRTSPSNRFLRQWYNDGDTLDVSLVDRNDNADSWSAVGCRITQSANYSAGSEATPIEWTILMPKVTY